MDTWARPEAARGQKPALSTAAEAAWLAAGYKRSIVSIDRYSIPYHLAFLRGDLAGALAQIDARGMRAAIFDATMTNYSADEIGAMLQGAGCAVEHDYGIRCMCDYWGDNERKADPAVFAQIEQLESALAERYPYKLLARYFMVVARKR
jgi:S-adenosylmethionine-dependent methyltransferase